MKQKIILCLVLLAASLYCSSSVLAQTAPTGTEENSANCDVCGYCSNVDEQGAAHPTKSSNWEACRNCLYPQLTSYPAESNKTLIGLPQPDQNHYYTMLGCLKTQPGEFAAQMTEFFFSIVGAIAFLSFLYGAVIIATSQANAERLNYGKRVVYASIAGLLFVLFSTFIIRFIAVDILKIPGFGG